MFVAFHRCLSRGQSRRSKGAELPAASASLSCRIGRLPWSRFCFDRTGQRFTASLLSIGLMRPVFYFFTAKTHRDRSAGENSIRPPAMV